MKFLHDKRRAGVLALLSALLSAAALVMGAGTAHAGYPCNDNPAPQDTNVNVSNVVFAGADPGIGIFGWYWACVGAPNGEAGQKWVVVTVADPAGGGPGMTVQAGGCTGVVPGQGFPPGCTYLVRPVGADAGSPSLGTNLPGSGAAGSGGSVGTSPCVWLESTTPNCPGSITVAGVMVNEADLVPTVTPSTPTPPCTGVNNTCIPLGATVRVFQDTANPTAAVQTPTSTSPTPVDVAPSGACVQVNATC